MKFISKKLKLHYLLISLLLVFIASAVKAEPPSGVARLSYIESVVSFLPGGTNKWVKAKVNRPLIQNDSLWVAKNSRAELQLGSAALRLGQSSYLKIFNLKKDIAQFQVTQGTVILNVYRVKANQRYEVNTPNLALSINKTGIYRIDVSKEATSVSIREGEAIVYGEKSAFTIRAGFGCQFTGTSLKGYRCKAIGPMDSFAKWSTERNRLFQKASKTKHVSTAIIGYEDLMSHGTWKSVETHGYVWIPDEVGPDWAPYRTGHWIWVRHYGWTWIDDQPWGFAPFHYGRWTYVEKRWAWVPGPVHVEPIYAPALVAFVGGRNFRIAAETRGVAWFPLGPGDIYIPPYNVSQDYFTQINIGNTIISNTFIDQVYIDKSTNITYQNFEVTDAVTAVTTETFIQSQPVSEAIVEVSEESLLQASTTGYAEVSPDSTSVLGSQEVTEAQPAENIIEQSAIVKTEPAPEPVPFSKEQELLTKNPGEPLAEKEIQTLQKQESDEQPAMRMVDPAVTPEPIQETPEGTHPALDTEQPGITPPTDVQQPPADIHQLPAPPADIYEPPVDVQQPPADVQQPPVDIHEPPVDVQQPPVDIHEPPVDVQQPPTDVQQSPAEIHQLPAPPADTYEPPLDMQQPPTETQQPTEEELLQTSAELQAPRPNNPPTSDNKIPHEYGEIKPPIEEPDVDVPLEPYGPKVPQHPELPGEVH